MLSIFVAILPYSKCKGEAVGSQNVMDYCLLETILLSENYASRFIYFKPLVRNFNLS
jgi:hypothetical protein